MHRDPPTDYQRWLRAASQTNVEAGEVQHYITPADARACGLLPMVGDVDWWLFDEARLVLMYFDDDYRLVRNELSTDPADLEQAMAWRDLALSCAHEVEAGERANDDS